MTYLSVARPNELYCEEIVYLEIDEIVKSDSRDGKPWHDSGEGDHSWEGEGKFVDCSQGCCESAQTGIQWNCIFANLW